MKIVFYLINLICVYKRNLFKTTLESPDKWLLLFHLAIPSATPLQIQISLIWRIVAGTPIQNLFQSSKLVKDKDGVFMAIWTTWWTGTTISHFHHHWSDLLWSLDAMLPPLVVTFKMMKLNKNNVKKECFRYKIFFDDVIIIYVHRLPIYYWNIKSGSSSIG